MINAPDTNTHLQEKAMTQPFDATAVIHSLSNNQGPNHPDLSNTDTVTIL